MTRWPEYESHKIVRAAKIVEVIINKDGTAAVLVRAHDDAPVEHFHPREPAMALRAEVGGYAVIYEDGYRSISPAKAFEEGYTPVSVKP